MQQLTVGGTSVLLDDATASVIIWYSVVLANEHRADCVEVAGYDADGNPVTAQLVLGVSGAVGSVSVDCDLSDPDNGDARTRILESSTRLEHPPLIRPGDIDPGPVPPHDLI